MPSFSILRWTTQASVLNEFDHSSFVSNAYIDGYQMFLSMFGWGGKSKWYCMWIVVLQLVIFKFLALFAISRSASKQIGNRHLRRPEAEGLI